MNKSEIYKLADDITVDDIAIYTLLLNESGNKKIKNLVFNNFNFSANCWTNLEAWKTCYYILKYKLFYHPKTCNHQLIWEEIKDNNPNFCST